MEFTVPRYEVRYLGTVTWEDISELTLMQKLHDTYDRVTPEILKMLTGKQVQTPEAVYRLKMKNNIKFLKRDRTNEEG